MGEAGVEVTCFWASFSLWLFSAQQQMFIFNIE